MLNEGFFVHYLTEDINIYNKYCNNSKCLTVLLINWNVYCNYGDFLEKYLFIILKLKAVISGKITPMHNISELFYNLEYITYIAIGHGVCYFKDFLFTENEIYGIKRNNKILIPPSKKLISVAQKYGWKDEDIIKINLPRWDEYEKNYDKSINNTSEKSSNFKGSFFQNPIINLKRNSSINEEEWTFKNIYNNYFCFCKGNKCVNKIIPQRCKYLFYMYIIDNNKDLYQKDNYLFVDFIFKEY